MRIAIFIVLLILGGLRGYAQHPKVYKQSKKVAGKEMPRPSLDLAKYLSKNLKVDTGRQISGREVVKFLVDIDGSLSQFRVVSSISRPVDSAVIRMLRKMPRWIPAKDHGKPVPMWFSLPVTVNAR